eukprot:3676114-Amphidinium_carterae.1
MTMTRVVRRPLEGEKAPHATVATAESDEALEPPEDAAPCTTPPLYQQGPSATSFTAAPLQQDVSLGSIPGAPPQSPEVPGTPAEQTDMGPPLQQVDTSKASTSPSPKPMPTPMEFTGADYCDCFDKFPSKDAEKVHVVVYSSCGESAIVLARLDALCHAHFLSNAFEGEMQLCGKFFRCAAAGYAALQFPEQAANLERLNAVAAMVLMQHYQKSGDSVARSDWSLMKQALEAKFKIPCLRQGLLKTGQSFLLEHASTRKADDWSDN